MGAGWRNLIHYAQIVHAEKFQRFDFNKASNLVKYGQTTPPEYDLSQYRVPIAIYKGDVDQLADPTDVAWLVSQLDPDLIVD